MQSLIKFLLKKSGLDSEKRFGKEWPNRAIIRSLLIYSVSFMRGLWHRIWFHKAAGMVLVGKGARIIHAGNLSVGKGFIVEEYAELNCLSSKGISIGNKVTIGSHALIRPTGKYGGEIGE